MRKTPEADIQRAIVTYLRMTMPHAIIHFSSNEGNRGGKRGMLDGKRRKAMGQTPGWPDLQVITYIGSLFFEVKAKGKYATPVQKALHKKIVSLGGRVAVVRSIDDVRDHLVMWNIGFTEKLDIRGSVG